MRELTDSEIQAVLDANGIGVLALDGGAHPYPLPVAFGYDRDRNQLVMQLEGDEDSEKRQLLSANANVGFTVFEETEPGKQWRSVVVRGELTETEYQTAEPAFASLAQYSQSAPNPVLWGTAGTPVTPHELEIHDWSGREFHVG